MKRTNRKIRRGGLSAHKYLTEPQIHQLLDWLHRKKQTGSRRAAVNEFIVYMLLYTGLRAEELLSLRMEDLPCCHGKNLVEVVDGKGGIARSVIVDEWMVHQIRQFVRIHRQGAKPGSILIPSEAGFRRVIIRRAKIVDGRRVVKQTVERSHRMRYWSLWDRLRRMGLQSGIGRLHPHMLRHTYLTRLYNIEHDLRLVQDQAGHARPETTAIYAQTADQSRIQQVKKLPKPGFR